MSVLRFIFVDCEQMSTSFRDSRDLTVEFLDELGPDGGITAITINRGLLGYS